MQYIISAANEGIDFDHYLAYLQSVREQLPAQVYAFASSPQHFDLRSPESLHDAWLESLSVRERSSGQRNEIRQLEVVLCLLGPRHDRHIHLHYRGVSSYSFQSPPRQGEPRGEQIAHGDLYTHEVRLGHAGQLVHELLFEQGASLLIECADFQHTQELLG